jgi:hypothetical protein
MDDHVWEFGFATSGAASFILHVEYEVFNVFCVPLQQLCNLPSEPR